MLLEKTSLEQSSLSDSSSEILLKNEFGTIELYSLSHDVSDSTNGASIKALRFVHHSGSGSISLHGGQVLTWQPKDQQSVFWLSEASKYSNAHAIRGGIPICWPWFGGEVKLANGHIKKTSNHGFARQNQWQLDNIDLSQTEVSITLSLTGEKLSNLWPAAFKLTQKLIFSDQFQQTLTMTNLSEYMVEYTGALHSYFCVSSPQQSNITTLESVEFDDKLSDEHNQGKDNQGTGSQLDTLNSCTGPIDRIYHSSSQQTITDHGWQREIVVTSENCSQWVMWNPGSAVASAMVDMHQHSEQEFVCLEAANTQFKAIASQESVSIGQHVQIKNI